MADTVTAAQGDDHEDRHPVGLCGETSCATCAQQTVDLGKRARAALIDEIDDALVLAGGEERRQLFTALVNKGLEMRQGKRDEPRVIIHR